MKLYGSIDILLNMIIYKFRPNIRFEKASAKTGYTWGKPASKSNILKILKNAGLNSYIKELGIKAKDVVAERWLVSDDLEMGSMMDGAKKQSLQSLFAEQGKELLGPKHFKEHGPYLGCIMKQLDTNEKPSRGSLSIQIHARSEHPRRIAKPEMWKGQGQIYLGFNKDMNEVEIQKAWQEGNLESLLNQITLTPDKLVLVRGGVIHAIRFNSFINEWSMAPSEDDINKGNLKDATVSPYDRTDGKTQRPGKEDLEGSIQLLRESDGFRKTKKEDLFMESHQVFTNEKGNETASLFRTPEVFVNQLTIKTELQLSTQDRGFPIYIDQGQIEVLHKDEVIDIMRAGQERFVPFGSGEVTLVNKASKPSVLQQWYAPFKGEK